MNRILILLICALPGFLRDAPASACEPREAGTPPPEQNCPEQLVAAFRFFSAGKADEGYQAYRKTSFASSAQVGDCISRYGFGPEKLGVYAFEYEKALHDANPDADSVNYNAPGYNPMNIPENHDTLVHYYYEQMANPTDTAKHPFSMGVIPGNSEDCPGVDGQVPKDHHHRGPSAEAEKKFGLIVCPNYARRLEDSLRLLENGDVRYLMITGGNIDDHRPQYNEAFRGKKYLLALCKTDRWKDKRACQDIARRIFLEPVAQTTISNIANTDKFCLSLGVGRTVIITDYGKAPTAGPKIPAWMCPDCGDYRDWDRMKTQFFYLSKPWMSTFAPRSILEKKQEPGEEKRVRVGFMPGEFKPLVALEPGNQVTLDRLLSKDEIAEFEAKRKEAGKNPPVLVVAHYGWNADALQKYDYSP